MNGPSNKFDIHLYGYMMGPYVVQYIVVHIGAVVYFDSPPPTMPVEGEKVGKERRCKLGHRHLPRRNGASTSHPPGIWVGLLSS